MTLTEPAVEPTPPPALPPVGPILKFYCLRLSVVVYKFMYIDCFDGHSTNTYVLPLASNAHCTYVLPGAIHLRSFSLIVPFTVIATLVELISNIVYIILLPLQPTGNTTIKSLHLFSPVLQCWRLISLFRWCVCVLTVVLFDQVFRASC